MSYKMDIKISKVEPCDVERLKIIAEESLFQTVDSPEEEKQRLLPHICKDIEHSVLQDDTIFLKAESAEIEGFILIKETWNLSQLFIAPPRQHQGVGGSLLDTAVQQIQCGDNKGYVKLNSSSNAVAFYAKRGFELDASREPKSKWSVPMVLYF